MLVAVFDLDIAGPIVLLPTGRAAETGVITFGCKRVVADGTAACRCGVTMFGSPFTLIATGTARRAVLARLHFEAPINADFVTLSLRVRVAPAIFPSEIGVEEPCLCRVPGISHRKRMVEFASLRT